MSAKVHKFIAGDVICRQDDWDKLSEAQRQFLREAHAGHFSYLAENGKVLAWGAAATSNLFSMEVETQYVDDNETLYWPEAQGGR